MGGVMKSGRFYKRYLGQLDSEDSVDVIAGKMDCGQNDEQEDTPEGASGDFEMETDDYYPDEMEGRFHEYVSPSGPGMEDQDDGEDSDFMEIFGDEVPEVDSTQIEMGMTE